MTVTMYECWGPTNKPNQSASWLNQNYGKRLSVLLGLWAPEKKSDAQSLPSGKAKLYNYFFAPSGQVETIIYAKIALWKIQNKQQQGEGVR